MISYVMVSADFPGVTPVERTKIYECLKEKKWKKVTEPGRDIDTVWYASFKDGVSEKSAKRISKDDFESCSKGYCTPKLTIHWGPNTPSFHNLT